MRPDDPRHGTNAGYLAGCRNPCCREAHNAYRRSVWRKRYTKRTDRLYVDATGTKRRIRALQALGWRFIDIDHELGRPTKTQGAAWSSAIFKQDQTKVHVDNARAIAEVYERISMTLGPSDLLRKKAAAWGWLPPLAWDDIDTDPDPADRTSLRAGRPNTDIDPAVVDRLLEGVRLPSTSAEKREAMRRWLAAGKSERSLCVQHGWKDGRYVA